MNTTRPVPAETGSTDIPAVPLTVEGYSTLHQMMRFRWTAWRALAPAERRQIAGEAMTIAGSDGQTKLELKRVVRHSPTEGAKPVEGADATKTDKPA